MKITRSQLWLIYAFCSLSFVFFSAWTHNVGAAIGWFSAFLAQIGVAVEVNEEAEQE